MPVDVLRRLHEHVVTPVVRAADTARAERVVTTLHDAGFRVFEITLTVPDATPIIDTLARTDGVTVGVGTVFTADEAREALGAGASFVVSPAAPPELVEVAHAHGAAAILGGLTPSEVWAAHRKGADAVKLFPIDSVGGADHVRALRNVFPDLALIPTGGVNLDNARAHLDAGAHSLGVGGALVGAADSAALDATARRYLNLRHAAPSRAADSEEEP